MLVEMMVWTLVIVGVGAVFVCVDEAVFVNIVV